MSTRVCAGPTGRIRGVRCTACGIVPPLADRQDPSIQNRSVEIGGAAARGVTPQDRTCDRNHSAPGIAQMRSNQGAGRHAA
jgi:hypothetical protein